MWPPPLRGEAGKPSPLLPLSGYKEGSDWTHFPRPKDEKAGRVGRLKRKGKGRKKGPLIPFFPPPSNTDASRPEAPGLGVCQGVGVSFICRSEIMAEATETKQALGKRAKGLRKMYSPWGSGEGRQ